MWRTESRPSFARALTTILLALESVTKKSKVQSKNSLTSVHPEIRRVQLHDACHVCKFERLEKKKFERLAFPYTVTHEIIETKQKTDLVPFATYIWYF